MRILAGLDMGYVNTKVVIIRQEEILGYDMVPSGFDLVAAAQTTLSQALDKAGISLDELARIAGTGIFGQMAYDIPSVNATKVVPEYVADAKGALFLNKNSRTVIDVGGNTCKAISYDQTGNALHVVTNDKCAAGEGIFLNAMAKALGLNEQEIAETALKSTKDVSITAQCTISAESEVVTLMSRDIDVADIADAVLKAIAERVAAMASSIPLAQEIVVAGGLAKSKALINNLSSSMKQDLSALKLPEFAGAIGAALTEL